MIIHRHEYTSLSKVLGQPKGDVNGPYLQSVFTTIFQLPESPLYFKLHSSIHTHLIAI